MCATGVIDVFGLIDTGELFSSSDGGVTWTLLSSLPAGDAVALAALLSPTDLYLASRSGGIYRSMDGGSPGCRWGRSRSRISRTW